VISEQRKAIVLIEGPDTPVELSFLFAHFMAHYVRKHGNTPQTHVEVLGAIEHAKCAITLHPGSLGASN
jgi:hypothetical protein